MTTVQIWVLCWFPSMDFWAGREHWFGDQATPLTLTKRLKCPETQFFLSSNGDKNVLTCKAVRIVEHVCKGSCKSRWTLVSSVMMMLPQWAMFRWICFKLFTLILKNQTYIYHSLHKRKGNWLCTFRYQPCTVRASRSGGLWTFGRREHLLFLRKNLEAGLPPPRTSGGAETLCKGNAEPWPWASLGDPGNGDCSKCPQRDGKWNMETVTVGEWCIINMLVATLRYR